MIRFLISMTIATVFTLPLPRASLADVTTEEVIADIEAKAANVTSFKATMSTTMELLGQQVTTPGTILFKKPNKTRVEVSIPMFQDMKQITISDGDTAWQYSPQMNLVTKTDLKQMRELSRAIPGNPAGGVADDITNPFKGMKKELAHYVGSRQLDGKEMYVFDLELPQQEDTANNPFLPARVQVWVSANDGLQRKVVSYNNDGKEAMVVTFSDLETNIDISDSEFVFTPPPDAQIVDMTQDAADMMINPEGDKTD